jgi:fumarylacetoacetase
MSATEPDLTHDPDRRSWLASANEADTDFPLQNLPFGAARNATGETTVVVAIGDSVLDLRLAAEAHLVTPSVGELVSGEMRLNRLLNLPSRELTGLRHALSQLLERGSTSEATVRSTPGMLRPAGEVELLAPTRIGSFTDFYAGIYHARAASKILIPGGDVAPNYRWVPIAYQSRASTVRPSGTPVRRPAGQLPRSGADPLFAPCEMLDFELELGFYIGQDTAGKPVPITDAAQHIAGFCLLNDWSARDIQRWEMAPLGPFLAKSFATTISPWMVTSDALRPFRIPAMTRSADDPAPLPYLHDEVDQTTGGLAVELAVWLRTAQMRAHGHDRTLLLRSDSRHLYWTPAQMVAHHTSGGCDLQTGDLLGTGTISGPAPEELGSLLELTEDGRTPVNLSNGEVRRYLEDGDEVTFTGRCTREGFISIGFGDCTGTVVPTETIG